PETNGHALERNRRARAKVSQVWRIVREVIAGSSRVSWRHGPHAHQRLLLKLAWKSLEHASDSLTDPLRHSILVVEGVPDTALRPSAPDHFVCPAIDDVEHKRTCLVLDDPGAAAFVIAIPVFGIYTVDVNALVDDRVIVNQQIGCPRC